VQYRNFKMAAVRQRQNFNRYGHLCIKVRLFRTIVFEKYKGEIIRSI
jgi:hypothetical protein